MDPQPAADPAIRRTVVRVGPDQPLMPFTAPMPVAVRVAGVAGAAGKQTVRGAKRVGTSVGRFFTGVGYFFQGAGHFLRSPRLWLLVLVPLVLTALAMAGLEEAVGALVDRMIHWLLGFIAGWPEALLWILEKILWFSAAMAFHMAMTALTVPLTMLFGAAFFPFITRSVIRRSGGPVVAAPPWYRAAGVCLRQTIVVTVVLHVGWLIMLPLLWIPGVNLAVAVAAGLVFNGFLIGLLVLAVPLHHHGVRRIGEQFRFAWRYRGFTLGFGVMSLCALIVPVLSLRLIMLFPVSPIVAAPGVALYLLTAPAVLVGSVLLHQRIVNGPPGPRPVAQRSTVVGMAHPGTVTYADYQDR